LPGARWQNTERRWAFSLPRNVSSHSSENSTFRHLPPTEALEQYAEQKIHRIGKYFSHPLEAHVILALDGKERKVAEVELRTRRATIVGKEQHQDLYAAIDLMVDKIERQIKKQKEKTKLERRKSSA
jgi:ribosome hibernation promoting factor